MPWAVAAAAVGVAGSVYSSNKAAKASGKGADQAAQVQQYMYDTSRRDMAPYRVVGESALGKLASLYGLESPEGAAGSQNNMGVNFNQSNMTDSQKAALQDFIPSFGWNPLDRAKERPGWADKIDKGQWRGRHHESMARFISEFGFDPYSKENNPYFVDQKAQQQRAAPRNADPYADFRNSPDYQFAFEQGQRGVDQSLAARGLTGSGRAMKELTRFGQGLASQQLGNYTNRLAALAGVGQTATQDMAQVGMNTANQIGSAKRDAADARASGYLGAANAINSGVEQGYGMYSMNRMMKQGGY